MPFSAGRLAALIWHLAEYAPLTLVVWSEENRSRHGSTPGGSLSQCSIASWSMRMLGADHATWTRCQLVRTPEAIRANGNRQAVEYFDPSSLPASSLT